MGANIYKNKKPLAVFLTPAFLFMIVYLYYPFFMNIVNSFQKIKMLGQRNAAWNDPWYLNYVELFQDPVVGIALKNTLIMMLVTIVGQVGIGCGNHGHCAQTAAAEKQRQDEIHNFKAVM